MRSVNIQFARPLRSTTFRRPHDISNPFLLARARPIAVAAALLAGPSWATDFELSDAGKEVDFVLVTRTAIRARNADQPSLRQPTAALVGRTDGTGNNTIDEGNLTNNKGRGVTTQVKLISEVALSERRAGRGWFAGKRGTTTRSTIKAFTSAAPTTATTDTTRRPTPWVPMRALSDRASSRSADSRACICRRLCVHTFDVGGQALQLRAGNQVVILGRESVHPGHQQVAPIDVPSFRKPGVQLKEVFSPRAAGVLPVKGSVDTASVEAFYQLPWKPTPIEAGAAITGRSPGPASRRGPMAAIQPVALPAAAPPATVGRLRPSIDGEKGKNSGQYGLAYRFQFRSTGIPNSALRAAPQCTHPESNVHYGSFLGVTPPSGVRSHRVGITSTTSRLFGVSAATNLFGLSVGAELSHQRGRAGTSRRQ